MRKLSCLLFIALLFSACNKLKDFIPSFSAPQFNKMYGGTITDRANSVDATLDGGYILAGGTQSNDGDVSGHHGEAGVDDAWIVKLNKSGNIQWEKAIGGSDHDVANSIVATYDGGYVMAGFTLSNDGDVSGNHGGGDAWVVRLDKEGNIIWQRTLGGSNQDYANAIITTLDGGYIMSGSTTSNDGEVNGNHGDGDAWVVKLSRDGEIQWQKALGGSAFENAFSISKTLEGGYIIAGFTQSNDGDVSGQHGEGDAWIVKLDNEGNILWQKAMGGASTDIVRSITSILYGGYVIAGSTSSNDGDVSGYHGAGDAWAVKLDEDGNINWQRTLGGSNEDNANAIITSLDGGYVLAGETESNNGDVSGNHGDFDAWVVKLDKSGNIRWQKALGGSNYDVANEIAANLHGDYIVAGLTESNDGDVSGNHGGGDAWAFTLKD